MCSSKAAKMHGQPIRNAKDPMQPLAAQKLFSLMVKDLILANLSPMPIHGLVL